MDLAEDHLPRTSALTFDFDDLKDRTAAARMMCALLSLKVIKRAAIGAPAEWESAEYADGGARGTL
jgi:hypothetical protein